MEEWGTGWEEATWWRLSHGAGKPMSCAITTHLNPQHTAILLSLDLSIQFSSVQSPSHVWLFVTPWTTACQAPISFTNSWSLLKLMPIESVMPSYYLIPYHPLLLLPSIFPSIRVFSNESVLHIRWPKYWSFSFSIGPSMNIQDWFHLGLTGLVSLQSKGLSRVFSKLSFV